MSLKTFIQFLLIFTIIWAAMTIFSQSSIAGVPFEQLKPWLFASIIVAAVILFLLWRLGDGALALSTIGKSKAKIYMEKQTGVTFKDVAGIDEVKGELIEIVEFLKNPSHYRRLGAHVPKGVLLVGPPGTGKTLLARAVAGEASVPFFSINGSEFVEMFVGVGAARVRDLFKEARLVTPSIVFIDELDALGRKRDFTLGGNDEKEHTLNQLLSEMDGFSPNENVIVLAATNRPEILDPALMRAGRFDRQVLVDRPDKADRCKILSLYIKKIRAAKDIDITEIASLTTGFTGADLASLVNEAALLATRRQASAVTMEDFHTALERILAGLEHKHRLINPKERTIAAYHEMGHALLAMAQPGTGHLQKVSIVQRGMASGGFTMQRATDDRRLLTRAELEAKIMVMLGGQAAEQLIFGQVSTGAADDLPKVSRIARDMVMRYGMTDTLGHVVYETGRASFLPGIPSGGTRQYSEKTAQEIDKAVHDIVQTAFERALSMLKKNRDCLEDGAQLLMKKESLDAKDLTLIQRKIKI